MSKKELIKKAIEIHRLNIREFKQCGFNKKITVQLITNYINADYNYLKLGGWSNEKINEHIKEYEINKESLILTMKRFQKVKNAISNKRLILNCTSNNGLNWDVHYVLNNTIYDISLIMKKALCNYRLNYDTGAFCVSCYGTSRPLELILNFGRNLGLSFDKIPQSQQII